MKLLYRRFIFYALVLIFVIAAPTIAIYTAGWRWNFKQKRAVKIGALSVDSLPREATITVNGRALGKTPALIPKLLPGQYEITLQKNQYHTWGKTLAVASGQTTFAHEITLFKKNAPQLLQTPPSSPTLSHTAPAPYPFYYDSKREVIAIVDNEKQQRLAELPGNRAIWSANDQPRLFVYSAHEVWQFNPEKIESTLITRLTQNIQEVLLVPGQNTIILVLPDRIRALELDLRDRQNTWDLTDFEKIKKVWLEENGRALFIEGTQNNQTGQWQLDL